MPNPEQNNNAPADNSPRLEETVTDDPSLSLEASAEHFSPKSYAVITVIVLAIGITIVLSFQKRPSETEIAVEPLSSSKLLFQVNNSDNYAIIYIADPTTQEVRQIIEPPYVYEYLLDNKLVVKDNDTEEYYRYNFVSNDYEKLNFPTIRPQIPSSLLKPEDLFDVVYINLYPSNRLNNSDELVLTISTNRAGDPPQNEFLITEVDRKTYKYSFSKDSFKEFPELQDKFDLASEIMTDNGEKDGRFIPIHIGNEQVILTVSYTPAARRGYTAVVDLASNTIQTVPGSFIPASIDPDYQFGFYRLISDSVSEIEGDVVKYVALNDVEQPIYSLEYSLDSTFSREKTEWLDDKSKVLMRTDDGIVLLDFKNNKTETIYVEPQLSDPDYSQLGSNAISSDGHHFYSFVSASCAKGEIGRYYPLNRCLSWELDSKVRVGNLVDDDKWTVFGDVAAVDVIGWVDID